MTRKCVLLVFCALAASSALAQPSDTWNLTTSTDATASTTDCSGTSSYPNATSLSGCQSYALDIYENWDPASSGDDDTDLAVFRTGRDATWFYYELEMRGSWNYDNSGTSRGYQLEIDTDYLSVGGDLRSEYWFVYSPDHIHDDDTTWDAEGDSKVKAYRDSNNDVGGNLLGVSESGSAGSFDGFNQDVTLASTAVYVRIITRGGKKVIQIAIRATVIGSPTAIRSRPWSSQSSTIDKGKMTWHDENVASDLASNRIDNASFLLSGVTPTAVGMAEIEAIDTGAGVRLSWRTGWESRNLGFNVYGERYGEQVRLNERIIPGSALALAGGFEGGFSYGFEHREGDSGWTYSIEDVELDGRSLLHDGISPRRESGRGKGMASNSVFASEQAVVKRAPFTRIVANGRSTAANAVSSNLARQWDIAKGSAIRIDVSQEGLHRIGQPELEAAGFNRFSQPDRLRIYRDGIEVPLLVNAGSNGRLDPSEFVEFWGEPIDLPSSGKSAYWLTWSGGNGRAMTPVNGNGMIPSPADFLHSVHVEERSIFFAALKNGDAESFFGPIVSPAPISQTVPATNAALGSVNDALLEVAIQGVTLDDKVNPDHQVLVKVNGAEIGSIAFDGQALHTATLEVPLDLLVEGDNVVTLKSTGGPQDVSLLDWIRLTYPHQFRADDNELRFPLGAQETAIVHGFTENTVRVFDVTDPSNPKLVSSQIASEPGGYQVTVRSWSNKTRNLVALALPRVLTPDAVVSNDSSSLHKGGASSDLIVISHADFVDAAQLLAQHRKDQGFRIQFVDIQDVYDEFSFGTHDPAALRDFLSRIDLKRNRITNVLLFGNATVDPRNYLGTGDGDFVPTRLVLSDLLKTASDDWFVDRNGDSYPELAIGRLPARTPEEALRMVERILSWDATGANVDEAVFVADKNDREYDFASSATSAANIVPSDVDRSIIDLNLVTFATARAGLLQALGAGVPLAGFMGHGSVGSWNKSSLFKTSDAHALQNEDPIGLVMAMTCLSGFFHDPYSESIAEALLRSTNGAAAVWASSAPTLGANQTVLIEKVLEETFIGQKLLGEAILGAKRSVMHPDARRTWILFGDPTMSLTGH